MKKGAAPDAPGPSQRWRHSARLTRLDAALLCAMGIGTILIPCFHGAEHVWDWSTIKPYLFRADGQPGLLLTGLGTTIRLTCWSIGFALIIGVLVGMARTSASLYARLMGTTFVELCRNTPPLVLVFLCYYFLMDQLLPGSAIQDVIRHAPPWILSMVEFTTGPVRQLDAFLGASITLGIYEGAYVAEIVRGGIQAVPNGQWDAGRALGFPRRQILRHVVLPQAARNMLPPLAGQTISTIKDSAIVSAISIQELTFQGMQIMATTYRPFEVWASVALLYFVLTATCSVVAGRLEERLRRMYPL